MNGPNKLECYITLGWKGLLGTNALAYWARLNVKNYLKGFHNMSFSSLFTNGPKKAEFYIAFSWKGFPGITILAYWTHL
jgi:ABC-type lipoprotein release transport system permease subunit